MLRIEVAELGRPVARTPTCPDASTWDGTQCVATEVVTHAECPEGATWDGTRCLRPAVAVRPASAAEPATPSRQLWGDPHPGKGWFCYQGLDRGSTVGHCDREPIECGMDLGRRVEAGMSTKMQRCDPQPQAVCFEARRESDAAPRSFCYPTPALCEADHTSLDARDDVASRTDCVVYR
jgi:hypothetical protein